MQPGKDAVGQKPADHVTLSAAEGEAMIARLAVYAPSRADCEILIQVVRWYFWLVWTVQEAKLCLTKLRTLLCGQGPKRPMRCEPGAASVSTPSRGDGMVAGDGSARDAEGERSTAAGSQPASMASAAEIHKPHGGHRPGTGRLGAEAYTGAERVECRHEELAVGQRCSVCGHGTLYALPPSVERPLTARPCSAPSATSWKSCAARHAARSVWPGFLRTLGRTHTAPERGRCGR